MGGRRKATAGEAAERLRKELTAKHEELERRLAMETEHRRNDFHAAVADAQHDLTDLSSETEQQRKDLPVTSPSPPPGALRTPGGPQKGLIGNSRFNSKTYEKLIKPKKPQENI